MTFYPPLIEMTSLNETGLTRLAEIYTTVRDKTDHMDNKGLWLRRLIF